MTPPHLNDRVGETVPTVEQFVVEAGKVAEYAAAVRNDDPIHRNQTVAESRGFRNIPAWLTFTATKRFPRYRPRNVSTHWGFDLGFNRGRTMHGEKYYDINRAVVVGDELSGETTLTDVYRKEGTRGGEMTFAVLSTEFTDANDERVLTERSTLIETQ